MRRLPSGSWQYSPKDLIAYLESDFAAWCERWRAEGSRPGAGGVPSEIPIAPDARDEEMMLAARKGDEHEKRHLDRIRAEQPGLVEIARGDSAVAETLAAMRAGAPVIYQGCLAHGDWQGLPDFLWRVEGASTLGAWHYEPWDTKLARSAKPYFLVQLCAYAELLEHTQGVRPASLRFILGDDTELSFKTDEFYYYYLQLKESFLAFQASWNANEMPDPGVERSYGNWSTLAGELLMARDHLSLVAGITRSQIRRLESAGISTLGALGSTELRSVPKIAAETYSRLRHQAWLQLRSTGEMKPLFKVRHPDPGEPRRGLGLLPPPSELDIWFDMEGFPFYPGGLEYLFGAVTAEGGTATFHDWWAHSEIEEKRAFEGFVDFAYARWQRDPAMHVYHYGAYEKTALRRLMGKYATRENEVDDLLRNEVLVDLLNVVRQGVTIGTTGYSLKDIECLYMPPRVQEVTSAGGSVVEYQAWVDSGESPNWNASPRLSAIREYNRVDCESTWMLNGWLRERQRDAQIPYWETLAAAAEDGAPEVPGAAEAPSAVRVRTPAELVSERLLKMASADHEHEHDAEHEHEHDRARVTELLAWLVEYHRREEKPMWWRMFDRLESTEETLRDDLDCLSALRRTEKPPRTVRRSRAFEYRYDPNEDTKLRAGDKCIATGVPATKCTIETMNEATGLIELAIGAGRTLPYRLSLIPDDHVAATAIKEAVLRVATQWADGNPIPRAVEDLLFRRPPRINGHAGGDLVRTGDDFLPRVIELITNLDHSTLCIQGPPGSGKTYTSAAAIIELLRRGKKVGIAANSHKVILNVMQAIVDQAPVLPTGAVLYKVGGDGDEPLIVSGKATALTSADAEPVAAGKGPFVLGGTAWLFSRPALVGTLDYLFIDEAGQVPLANAVAMGASASNVILIGDQMQLPQPLQGTHPGESGMSCLEYMLRGHATIPPEFGIFLGVSYRMHPDVCRFISDAFYEGRLTSTKATHANRIVGEAPEHGVMFIEVDHEGCSQSSEEEVQVIAPLVEQLLGRTLESANDPARGMTLNDLLLVAPFNMQVRELRGRLGDAARVGSVDKFQGQEAPVVIVSMCSSSLEDCPRGAEFLLSPNRLNVAVSRAKALAIVVGAKGLMTGRSRSVEEMRQVNVLCRLKQLDRS